MSERPIEWPPAQPAKLMESALAIVVSRTPFALRVLVGRRARTSRFLPGQWAFPGGRLETEDDPARPGAHARCAARELHEETGVSLSTSALIAAGVRTTPPFHALRFRTEFFLALIDEVGSRPPAVPPRPEEIDAIEFADASALLREWESGARALAPPVLPILRALLAAERGASAEALALAVRCSNDIEERVPRIEPVPGFWLLPLLTQTLPPATHTNAYLAGGRAFVIVDPGSSGDADIESLLRVITRRQESGDRPLAIVLTHHHRDHVSGAPVLADRLHVPIVARPETLARVPFASHPSVRAGLAEGESLDLAGCTLRVAHVPGHAPGHVALIDDARRTAIVGDMVSGLSTIVIPPESGDMGLYLESLRRLEEEGLRTLLPAHGPPLPAEALLRARQHREARAARIEGALHGDARSLAEIAAAAYAGEKAVDARLAEAQTMAHLEHLEAQGRARRREGGWARA